MREGDGDILVFFSGEREIREAAEAIDGQKWRGVEVLPLFGRLSNAEQHRVFGPHASRRIVLATNIAETSLTVPGIHYVVDTGTARISRYSTRTKVQRLPVEPVSQASANQRSGRCGRVADGIAIRLYSEEDFLSRPEFTDPEIQRTNLASVILQMANLAFDVAAFPFVDALTTRLSATACSFSTNSAPWPEAEDAGLSSIQRARPDPTGRELARTSSTRGWRACWSRPTPWRTQARDRGRRGTGLQDVRERPLESRRRPTRRTPASDTTSDFLSC